MAFGGIDVARNNYNTASETYAKLQEEMDKYNRIFEAYANASPETQLRASSVMRQALNVYNGLKAQQEENAIRMYEAQNQINNFNKVAQTQPQPQTTTNNNIASPVQSVQPLRVTTVANSVPGVANKNTPVAQVDSNPIVNNNATLPTTAAVTPTTATVSASRNTVPVSVTKIVQSQTPQYSGTTISPVTPRYTYTGTNYGAGNMAGMNNLPTISSGSSLVNRTPTGQRMVNRGRSLTSLVR